MTMSVKNLFFLFIYLISSTGKAVEISNSPMAGMMTFPVFFISDNQFHNYLSDPTALRNVIADRFVRVAIRPPLQDLFASDLFLYALEKYSRNNFVIQLGDALNISCKNEWKRFEESMNTQLAGRRINNGWVMVPGNHDSFFFGNTLGIQVSESSPVLKAWIDACNTVYPPLREQIAKDFIFTKDVFVKNYYRNLLNQGKENPIDFPKLKNVDCYFNSQRTKNVWYEKGTAMALCDWQNNNPDGFLQKFRFTYPQRDDVILSYRAYIVQEINLSKFFKGDIKVKGILLDTSDYKNTPTLVTGAIRSMIHLPGTKYNAGVNGSLGKDQIETIKRWIREDGGNSFYIFMSHHNLVHIDEDSRKKLNEIFQMTKNNLYISSHTHEGFIKDQGVIKEINLGSITDFPNQAMYLSIKDFGKDKGNIGFYPNILYITAKNLEKEGVCSQKDFADNDPNPNYHYLAYKKLPGIGTANQIHELTIDSNLMGLYKAFKKLGLYNNTSDPVLKKLEEILIKSPVKCGPPIGKGNTQCRKEKVDLLNQVIQIDKGLYTSPLREERIKYGACQTLWAAKAEMPLKK
jgi:predicted phosphodiesterase